MKQFGMIKKALVFVLSFGLLAGLAACGDKATPQSSNGTNVPSGGSEAVVSQPVGGNTGGPVQGEEGWFNYEESEGGVSITGYTGEEGAVIFPDTLGGKPVVGISSRAFNGNSIFTSVTLPDSITFIENEAFQLCENLEYVDMGNGVIEVGDEAFSICMRLKEVVFSSSLEKAGKGVFASCQALANVEIPLSLTSAGNSLFADSGIVEITIPSSMGTVPERFLDGASKLQKVVIEDGITYIGYEAFDACVLLEELYIPASVTEIDDMIYSMDMDFTIIAPSGSVGETYAIEYEIPYRNE